MNKKRILYVEDELGEDVEDDEVWLGLIESEYDVTPARTGQEAWDYLDKDKYDLILLDIMLPPSVGEAKAELSGVMRMDMGLHLLKKLRSGIFESKGNSAQIPVVVVTAVTGVDRWQQIINLVGNDSWCLTKPCSPNDILNVIRNALC